MTPPPVPHYIYRCYDADGLLLYIGCTSHVANRMRQHRKDEWAKASRWLQVSMARYEVDADVHPGKKYAHLVEACAIRDEAPLFNRQGQVKPGWMIENRVADYLIEHGHVDLAIETTCRCRAEYENYCRTHELLAELRAA